MNRDRLVFYLLHGGAKPLLFLSGVMFVWYGFWLGAALMGSVWTLEVLADVWYWKNFDAMRGVPKGTKAPFETNGKRSNGRRFALGIVVVGGWLVGMFYALIQNNIELLDRWNGALGVAVGAVIAFYFVTERENKK